MHFSDPGDNSVERILLLLGILESTALSLMHEIMYECRQQQKLLKSLYAFPLVLKLNKKH